MKTPKPTDPITVANAQTGSNVSTAIANNVLQNGTTITPDGTRTTTWDGGTYDYTDPTTGTKYSIPLSKTVESLSPNAQAVKTQTDAADLNLATIANTQTQKLGATLNDPFSYTTGQHEAWAGDQYNKLNAETNAQNDEALRTRLANQGIKQGSEAYKREMEMYAKGRDNARNQFMLDAQGQGFQQAMASRNQLFNEQWPLHRVRKSRCRTLIRLAPRPSQPRTWPGFTTTTTNSECRRRR